MPSLRDEQRTLQEAIRAANDGGPVPKAGDRGRLAVYRHAYLARMERALRTNYPVLARLAGDEAFEAIARAYAAEHPSRHFSIRWHGEALSLALKDCALAELAQMEWALGTAFDAPDATALDAAGLSRYSAERLLSLRLCLHPSVRVLQMSWNVEAQWEAVRGGAAAARCEKNEHSLLVWRKNLQAHWRIASVEEGRTLRTLESGGTLQAACEAALASPEEIGAWFAAWVGEGMLMAAGAEG